MSKRPFFKMGIIVVVLFFLYIVSFFHIKVLPMAFWATGFKLQLPFYAAIIYTAISTKEYQRMMYKRLFKLYVFFIVLNFFTCYFYRGQSIFVSYNAWFPMLFFFLYPFFKCFKMSARDWEKVLFILFVIILLCYSLQYIFIHIQLFILDTTFERLDAETRVRIFSDAILILGAFFSLNKFLCGQKKYIVFYIWASLIIFLQNFRMIMLMYSVVSVYMYIKVVGFNRKMWIAIPFVILLLFFFSKQTFVQEKMEELEYRSQSQSLDNSDYVRVLCFDHYMNYHFKSNWERFWGSGRTSNITVPSMLKDAPSNYSKYISEIGLLYHWYAYDWGLIGLSWEAGIPFMLVFIWLIISIIRAKVEKSYLYIGLWEFYLLLIGVTNEQIFYHNNIVYQALVLVILDKVRIDKKENMIRLKIRRKDM